MSTQKPIYLMAGGRGSKTADTIIRFATIVRSVFGDTGKIAPNIAYVGAASDDNRVFYHMIAGRIKHAGDCKVNRVVLCSKKANLVKARSTLQSADAVFMSGGDVGRGMQVLKEKDMTGFFRDLYQQGKLFFGVSAGSIMLAREWVRWSDPKDDSTAELFPCLGLAPVICDTHAEEDDWEELKAALQLKEAGSIGYGMPSGACLKVYPDGRVEALGGAIARYIRRNGKVEWQADLLPVDEELRNDR